MSALDVSLSRYTRGVDSVAPPPAEMAQFQERVVGKIRDVSQSGSWDVERALGEQKTFYEKALLEAIWQERLAAADRLLEEERRRAAAQRVEDHERFKERLDAANAAREAAEKKLEKRDDRTWQVALIVIGLVITAIATRFGFAK